MYMYVQLRILIHVVRTSIYMYAYCFKPQSVVYYKVIDLSSNQISRLSGLQSNSCLMEIYLQENVVNNTYMTCMHVCTYMYIHVHEIIRPETTCMRNIVSMCVCVHLYMYMYVYVLLQNFKSLMYHR